MTKVHFYKFLISGFLIISFHSLSAQSPPGYKATLEKSRILIGEQVILKLEARIPNGQNITLPDIDTIPHFEILEDLPESRKIENNQTLIIREMRITSFDSGHWVIPSFRAGRNYKTDTIGVDVVFSDFDPNQAYHDIRDIINVQGPEKKDKKWYYITAGAFLLALLIWFLLRKKKKVIVQPPSPENAYEEAMQQLELLHNKGLTTREYYSGVVMVYRTYLFKKKGILSMQKTTDGLILQLKDLVLDKDQFAKLSQALRLSDFVKFARFVPDAADDQMVFETIKNSIRYIEDLK